MVNYNKKMPVMFASLLLLTNSLQYAIIIRV
jgi:hypothetical protein